MSISSVHHGGPCGKTACRHCGKQRADTAANNVQTLRSCLWEQGPEFVVEFYKVIPRSLRHSLKHFDEATRNRVNRLIGVWDDRKVCQSNSLHMWRLQRDVGFGEREEPATPLLAPLP